MCGHHVVGAPSVVLGSACQVRSFAKEAASIQRYQGSQNKVLAEGLKSARASGFFNGVNGLVGTGSIVLVLWFGARQVRLLPSPLQKAAVALAGDSCGLICIWAQVRMCDGHPGSTVACDMA